MVANPFNATWTWAAVALVDSEAVVAPLKVRVKVPAGPVTVRLPTR